MAESECAVRRLTSVDEWVECGRIVGVAFMEPFDEDQERSRLEAAELTNMDEGEVRFGGFDERGRMVAGAITMRRTLATATGTLTAGEVHQLATLPEARGAGHAAALMRAMLAHFKDRGDALALLIPFSDAFYRAFGFERAAHTHTYRIPLEELRHLPCQLAVEEVRDEGQVGALRALKERVSRGRPFEELTEDSAWEWQGAGEFGERSFFALDLPHTTYALSDETCTRAYVTFVYRPKQDDPFTGEIEVTELVFDGPEALAQTLAFVSRLSAKATHVSLTVTDALDLSLLARESARVGATEGGATMARALDAGALLACLPWPRGYDGEIVVEVRDPLLGDGCASATYDAETGQVRVEGAERSRAMLTTDVGTFTQLALGRISLAEARLRPATRAADDEALSAVFVRRAVHLLP